MAEAQKIKVDQLSDNKILADIELKNGDKIQHINIQVEYINKDGKKANFGYKIDRQIISKEQTKEPTKPQIEWNTLEYLDVIMFVNLDCYWCNKMINLLDSVGELKNIIVFDVFKPENKKIVEDYGANDKGLPCFVSRKNKTGSIGYKNSVAKLVKSLSNENFEQ